MHRRTFFQAAAAAGALAAVQVRPSLAIEPIERLGEPKFKFSLAAYSYRSLLAGKEASLTLADFISDCAKFGLEGTELTSYYFPSEVTTEYLNSLKGQCFRLGLGVSGTAVGNDFGNPDPEARKQAIALVNRWADYSSQLGAPVIRIFAGKQQRGVSEDETHRLIVSAIEECCEYAGQRGVHLALENHGGPTSTAEGLLKIVRDVKSPWFGVNLDTGNFHEGDVYGQLAKCAPYALNVQVKVVISDGSGKRPTDYPRLAGMLREAGYRGYIVLEYEEGGDPRSESPRHLDELRRAFS